LPTHSPMMPHQKNIVSSAYCRMLISTLDEPTVKPRNKFLFTASLTSPVSASATILNRKGANGSPCLSPLWGKNSDEGLPLIKTEMDADFKHPSIHCIHLAGKPIRLSMYNRNSHDRVICLLIIHFEDDAWLLSPCSLIHHLICY